MLVVVVEEDDDDVNNEESGLGRLSCGEEEGEMLEN